MQKRYLKIVSIWSMLLFLTVGLSACKRIKKEYVSYQATKAHDKGNFKTAIEKYKKVLEDNPQDASLQYNLGVAYIYNKQTDKAKQQVKILIDMKNEDYAKILQQLIDQSEENASKE